MQPDPMFWCVMNFQFFSDPVGFQGRKCLVYGGNGMGIQVVPDKYNLITIRIADSYKIPDFLYPVGCCTVLSHAYMPHVSQGLDKNKDADGISFFDILIKRYQDNPCRVSLKHCHFIVAHMQFMLQCIGMLQKARPHNALKYESLAEPLKVLLADGCFCESIWIYKKEDSSWGKVI